MNILYIYFDKASIQNLYFAIMKCKSAWIAFLLEGIQCKEQTDLLNKKQPSS